MASRGENGYAALATKQLCWDGSYFGAVGTGYTTAGVPADNLTTFDGRVSQVVADDPTVVIVQGGTNDTAGTAAVEAAAAKVFADLRAGLPTATIIAVGPTTPPEKRAADITAARTGIEQAASAAKVPFIDADGWVPASDYDTDGIHPDPAAYADRFVSAINGLNLTNVSRCS